MDRRGSKSSSLGRFRATHKRRIRTGLNIFHLFLPPYRNLG
ncbi:hypothetical protein HMPREF0277_0084 [Corynebacterium accolens ATCC 49726]|nr:hypothetical protein HMPREF0276_0805 [Corynebacterium accolens ATCC 49725]EFM44792.1 hypothetical protein HMPREF0277_0084 [Corynebacterium accolens ATCC 49726]